MSNHFWILLIRQANTNQAVRTYKNMAHVLSFTYGLSIADLGSFGHKFGGKSHEV